MLKYKFFLFIGISLMVFKSYGQFQVGLSGSGVVPLEFSFEFTRKDKGGLPIEMHSHTGKMGYSVAPFVNLKLDRHRLGFRPSYYFLPGKREDNEYLKYSVRDTKLTTFAFDYAYFISKSFYVGAELGMAYFIKPSTLTGLDMGLGVGYVWRDFEIGVNLTHVRKNGHLNMITFGVAYKILDNL